MRDIQKTHPVIRVATVSDVPAIFSIRTSVVQNHLSMEQLAEMGITPHSVSEVIHDGGGIWVAEVQSKLVAFAMVDRDDGCVFAMFVLPAYEGLGLGRLLMQEAEACLFATHETIWLETDGDIAIRANGFYRALGWRPVDMQDNGDIRYEKRRPLY